ncbi:S-phase kinase-associated protein 1-like [Toxorhynchites rutilus septentrionalis]|uniref:S-phase kinase-associated protein 1-like n=1 Tax=Toxorhynchites rutilus septentrionalis TaxID=329112 RepID=UPI00247961F5|nr:S-phase kinase-associated protein 1-like [Toxorhynchites rutilus septentrionalis]
MSIQKTITFYHKSYTFATKSTLPERFTHRDKMDEKCLEIFGSLLMNTTLNIKLQSSDGEVFNTDAQIAQCSGTIKTVFQYSEYSSIPMNSEYDENNEKLTDDISSWKADFLMVDQRTLFERILAVKYLDVKALVDATCKTVANMIKWKPSEEIGKSFNIKNDFTSAEEEGVWRMASVSKSGFPY